MLVSPAPYLPFLDAHKGEPPGLWALDPAAWIEIDAAFAEQMAYRDRLIGERADVVAGATPRAARAVAELTETLAAHLQATHGAAFLVDNGAVRRPDGVTVMATGGIGALGRFVQEDWLILEREEGAEEYVLTAGNLCFPSSWRLRDKLGRPLTPIHEDVPGYADDLSRRVNRVFAALHVERPLQRLNWSVYNDSELHQPHPDRRRAATGDEFYLRVERQTLRRLPDTRAVVFGVKTYVTPLAALPASARAGLSERLSALSPAMVDYKGGPERWRDALARLEALQG